MSTEMHLNNLSSALSHRSSKLVKSPGQKPALMLRLMNACIRPFTSALAKPHQACEAYVSLAMTDARKIVCWFFSFIPLDRRIRRAYSDCPDDAIISDTWSAMEKLLVSVTPRNLQSRDSSHTWQFWYLLRSSASWFPEYNFV